MNTTPGAETTVATPTPATPVATPAVTAPVTPAKEAQPSIKERLSSLILKDRAEARALKAKYADYDTKAKSASEYEELRGLAGKDLKAALTKLGVSPKEVAALFVDESSKTPEQQRIEALEKEARELKEYKASLEKEKQEAKQKAEEEEVAGAWKEFDTTIHQFAKDNEKDYPLVLAYTEDSLPMIRNAVVMHQQNLKKAGRSTDISEETLTKIVKGCEAFIEERVAKGLSVEKIRARLSGKPATPATPTTSGITTLTNSLSSGAPARGPVYAGSAQDQARQDAVARAVSVFTGKSV